MISTIQIPMSRRKHEKNSYCRYDDQDILMVAELPEEYRNVIFQSAHCLMSHKFVLPFEKKMTHKESINNLLLLIENLGSENSTVKNVAQMLKVMLNNVSEEYMMESVVNKFGHIQMQLNFTDVTNFDLVFSEFLNILNKYITYQIPNHYPVSITSQLMGYVILLIVYICIKHDPNKLLDLDSIYVHRFTCIVMDLLTDRFGTKNFVENPTHPLVVLWYEKYPQSKFCSSMQDFARMFGFSTRASMQNFTDNVEEIFQPYVHQLIGLNFTEKEKILLNYNSFYESMKKNDSQTINTNKEFPPPSSIFDKVLKPLISDMYQNYNEYQNLLANLILDVFINSNLEKNAAANNMSEDELVQNSLQDLFNKFSST